MHPIIQLYNKSVSHFEFLAAIHNTRLKRNFWHLLHVGTTHELHVAMPGLHFLQ